MFGDIFRFLLEITFTLFGTALLARAWIHTVRLHPFNPVARTIFQVTDWLIVPLRKVIRPGNTIDWSSLAAAWLTAIIYWALLWMVSWGALLPLSLIGRMAIVALLTVPKWALNLMVWLTLLQAILSWVNPMAPMMALLKTLTTPLLDPIRRVLPATAIDFSPLIVLVLAQVGLMVLGKLNFSLVGM